VGRLRPGVVLYGEDHREGEAVGECVRRDLLGLGGLDRAGGLRSKAGKGPDLLIVAGTSLQVPGTKRIVREFAKSVRVNAHPSTSAGAGNMTTFSEVLPTPAPSPRLKPSSTDSSAPPPIKTIYINLDFPVPAREWEGVFDVWIQGDVQTLAKHLQASMARDEEAKLIALERRAAKALITPVTPLKEGTKKRKAGIIVDTATFASASAPIKRRLKLTFKAGVVGHPVTPVRSSLTILAKGKKTDTALVTPVSNKKQTPRALSSATTTKMKTSIQRTPKSQNRLTASKFIAGTGSGALCFKKAGSSELFHPINTDIPPPDFHEALEVQRGELVSSDLVRRLQLGLRRRSNGAG